MYVYLSVSVFIFEAESDYVSLMGLELNTYQNTVVQECSPVRRILSDCEKKYNKTRQKVLHQG